MHFKDNSSKYLKYLPALVFLIFIFGMAVWFLFNPKSDYSSTEKRYLKVTPKVSVESVLDGSFGKEFESFFADQFPSRSFWVGLNAYYNLDIGNNGANGVYNCKNGYLINKPVSTDNQIKKNTQAIIDFKNSVDTPVTAVFVPSTGYIAQDVLPSVHNKYNDDEYFESSSKAFAENGIDFVDLRQTFKDAYNDGSQLYYKTDHHWTTLGAYTAYNELCKQLDITPAPKEKFEIETYGGFYGTTYSTSGFWFTQPDNIEIWNNTENTDKNINVKITEGKNTEEYGSMYFYNHLKEDDKYPVFIDGNHALTEITNSNADGGTILIVKDSFAHSFVPFLAENYSKIILVDMRYYKSGVARIVQEENPERILFLYGIDNLATDTDLVWIN